MNTYGSQVIIRTYDVEYLPFVVSRWLRLSYDERAPLMISTLDVVVLTLMLDAVHRSLLVIDPADATRQLHITPSALLVILPFNALRCSVRVAVWTALLACAASPVASSTPPLSAAVTFVFFRRYFRLPRLRNRN